MTRRQQLEAIAHQINVIDSRLHCLEMASSRIEELSQRILAMLPAKPPEVVGIGVDIHPPTTR